MRIAIDIAEIARGGMERQVIQLASGLKSRGHDVLLITQKRVLDYGAEIAAARLDVVELGREKRTDPRVLSDLVSALRRFRPDVVVCENFNATLWGRLAALLGRFPVVTAEHSTDRVRRSSVVMTNRALGPFTEAVVACAQAQVPSLRAEGNPADRIVVIPNGVDTFRFVRCPSAGAALRRGLCIPPEAFVVGMAAAHRPEKRHDRFIELIGLLLDAGHEVWGLAVGGGSLLEATRLAAASSRARERVIVAGACDDMVAAYSAMDVTVLLSDSTETFPLVSLESQSCRVPVLALDVGGVSETMDPGRTGFIAPQGDLGEIARLIAELMDDPERLARTGAEARHFVSTNLSETRMVSAWEALLNEMVHA